MSDQPAIIWNKPAVIEAWMASGRPGYDALLVRWKNGKTSYVLVPKAGVTDTRVNPKGM